MTEHKEGSIIQNVERYGAIMFVSFSVGNTGPFKETTGITTLAENLKKEFLEENTFEVSGQNYNKISYIYGANGSGKTNYLAALTKMQKMIIMSTVTIISCWKYLQSRKSWRHQSKLLSLISIVKVRRHILKSRCFWRESYIPIHLQSKTEKSKKKF